MKVYVTTLDCAYDGDYDDLVVNVFTEKSKAISFLADVVAEHRKYAEEHDWVIECDYETIFRACEQFNYPENHVEMVINECDVE